MQNINYLKVKQQRISFHCLWVLFDLCSLSFLFGFWLNYKMQQTKFDYHALKLEYFASDIDEIKWFRLDKGLNYNSRVATMTKGRGEEKQKRKDWIIEKALAKKQKELADKMEISFDDLLQAKKTIIDLLQAKLKQYAKELESEDWEVYINMKDLEKIWKITKTELGEPTFVSKNENKDEFTWNWPLVQIIRADINK